MSSNLIPWALGALILVALAIRFVIAQEYAWWAPRLAKAVIGLVVRTAPRDQRDRLRAEWVAEFDAIRCEGHPGLGFALFLMLASPSFIGRRLLARLWRNAVSAYMLEIHRRYGFHIGFGSLMIGVGSIFSPGKVSLFFTIVSFINAVMVSALCFRLRRHHAESMASTRPGRSS